MLFIKDVPMTNKTIATASCLSLILTGIHVFGGGPDVHVPLLESDASETVKGFASVVWHSVTAALLLCSGMLLIAAMQEKYRSVLTWLVIVYYSTFAGLFLFYGIVRLGTIFLMLPWIGFVVIVAVAFLGLFLGKRSPSRNP
jgi:hypothetical protein